MQLDSEDGGCEVLVYKSDDGSTYHIPVEYIDDSVYDEIFGRDDKPFGGSLPDLPSGQVLDASLLEDQWKRSRLQCKVCEYKFSLFIFYINNIIFIFLS